MEDFDRRSTMDVDWLLGAALMVRGSALDAIGLLDERFFLYFEDTDWCRRFWKGGYRVTFFAAAEMVHYHERGSAKGNWLFSPFRKSTRIHIASAIKYFRKWRGEGPVGPSAK
jgi:GT2 family glycosyltransferase